MWTLFKSNQLFQRSVIRGPRQTATWSRRQCETIRFIGANEVVIAPVRLSTTVMGAAMPIGMDVEKFSVSTKLSKVLVGT